MCMHVLHNWSLPVISLPSRHKEVHGQVTSHLLSALGTIDPHVTPTLQQVLRSKNHILAMFMPPASDCYLAKMWVVTGHAQHAVNCCCFILHYTPFGQLKHTLSIWLMKVTVVHKHRDKRA